MDYKKKIIFCNTLWCIVIIVHLIVHCSLLSLCVVIVIHSIHGYILNCYCCHNNIVFVCIVHYHCSSLCIVFVVHCSLCTKHCDIVLCSLFIVIPTIAIVHNYLDHCAAICALSFINDCICFFIVNNIVLSQEYR